MNLLHPLRQSITTVMKVAALVLVLFATFLGSATAQAQLTDSVSLHGFGTWAYGQTNHYLSGNKDGSYDHIQAGFNIRAALASNLSSSTPVAWVQEDDAPEEGLDNVFMHGFGTWAYGQTNGNHYLSGNKDGSYDHIQAGFNVRAALASNLSISTQVAWVQEGDDLEVGLDYAFGEYKISDFFKVRTGRVKHPFGIFSEVHDIGTLQPFLSLAQSIYGPVGIIAEGYNGVGISGAYFGSTWGLEYDVYGGQVQAKRQAPFAEEEQEGEDVDESTHVEDVVGARLRFHTPLEGLELGVSSYTGTLLESEGAPRQTNVGAHSEYTFNQVTLRAEYVHQTLEESSNTDAFYVEAGYHVNSSLEVVGRYDWLKTTLKDRDHQAEIASSYFNHQDIVFGVNYWLHSGFVFKAAVHNVKGNRFAIPVEQEGHEQGAINLGKTPESQIPGLDNRTFLFQAGLQFSF